MTDSAIKVRYRKSDHYQKVADALAQRAPLPAVEEVVGPFVQALLAVHDLGEYQLPIDGLGFALEEGEFREEAGAMLELVEGIATAVEVAVDAMVGHDTRMIHAANVRAAALAIIDTDGLRQTMGNALYRRMAYDD